MAVPRARLEARAPPDRHAAPERGGVAPVSARAAGRRELLYPGRAGRLPPELTVVSCQRAPLYFRPSLTDRRFSCEQHPEADLASEPERAGQYAQ